MRVAKISIVPCHRKTAEGESLDAVLARARDGVAAVAGDSPDLVLLPELFANPWPPGKLDRPSVRENAQTLDGPVCERMSGLARIHRTHVAFGLLRRDAERIFNSLVICDREGRAAWIYDKTTPMAEEMQEGGITPGIPPLPYAANFGRVGAAICFDINFLELAEMWARRGTEIVLFASAFPGGRLLDFWAVRYGLAVAASTWYADNRVIDCAGATVARTSDVLPNATAVLNLNRRVVHMDGNLAKIDTLRRRFAGDLLLEDLRPEAACVLSSLRKGLEVDDLIRDAAIERLPDYFDRARALRASLGGMPDPGWRTLSSR